MGIFKRGKDDVEDIFGMDDNSGSNTSQQSQVSATHHQQPAASAPARQPVQKKREVRSSPGTGVYGIEDAIKLMRQLPNVDPEILITVVNKTLESANIKVSEIITDAETKESHIEERNVRLSTRIDELQQEISQLNNEITTLTADLKETSKVKNLLLLSVKKIPGDGSKATNKSKPPAEESQSKSEQQQQVSNNQASNSGGMQVKESA